MNDCRFVTLLLIVIEELFDVIFCFCLEFLIMLSNTDVGPADVQMWYVISLTVVQWINFWAIRNSINALSAALLDATWYVLIYFKNKSKVAEFMFHFV